MAQVRRPCHAHGWLSAVLIYALVLAACQPSAARPAATADTPGTHTVAVPTGAAPIGGQMSIRYARGGGHQPPRDREILEIGDDGAYTMWRSVGWATDPPTPVGRFAGQLTPDQQHRLQDLATAAAAAGNLSRRVTPDSPVETIAAGAAEARLGAYDEPDGAWGELIASLRQWLGELTATPQAAIALEVQPDGQQARLSHRGATSARIDLSQVSVRAVLWDDYDKKGDWRAAAPAAGASSGAVEVGPGWSLDLPFNHGFTVGKGQEVVAYVTFSLMDGQLAVPVALQSPRRAQ